MALILDWTTGLLSSQFYVTFDPSLCTVKQDKFDLQLKDKARIVINDKERNSIDVIRGTPGISIVLGGYIQL